MKTSYLLVVVVIVFAGILLPQSVRADPIPGTLPFGGLVSYTLPCTCPGSIGNLWIWFVPFFLGSHIPVTGPLVYAPYVSQLYAWYMIGVPTTWHLGSYLPGVQACWMLVPPPGTGCIPWPAAGVITQVGTSKPGGLVPLF